MKTKYEIEKVLVLSTGHITEKDAGTLDKIIDEVQPGPIVYGFPYGYYIYVGSEVKEKIKDAKKAGLSKYFCNLFAIAHSLNCQYIKLDADGPAMDNLPLFNW